MRAFAHAPSGYGASLAAREEVRRLHDDDRLGLAALENERVLGYVGAIKVYRRGWELHPLAVDPSWQRRGIGSMLVRALEDRARSEGVLTLYLGTDDETGGTTLFGMDLFPDPLTLLRSVEVTSPHPIAFYRRLGFAVTGVLPDVNGRGKPDIFMAKRL